MVKGQTPDDSGTYPPPSTPPSGDPWSVQVFYEGGSNTGSEGVGGNQSISGVTNTIDPQLSWADLQSFAPSTTVVSWAGTVVEIDLTSGGSSHALRFVSPFTPASGSYSGAPSNFAANGVNYVYVTLPTLTKNTWASVGPVDLNSAIAAAINSTVAGNYTVTGITVGDHEGTTSAGYPYPNETSYFANVSITGAPGSVVPEAPEAVLLPGAGLAILGGGYLVLRRRRNTSPAAG